MTRLLSDSTSPGGTGPAPGEGETQAQAGESPSEQGTPVPEAGTSSANPTEPGTPGSETGAADPEEPFPPEVRFSGDLPGYESHEDDVAEGFYRDFSGENGCTFQHRIVMAGLLGSEAPLSNEYASVQALTDVHRLQTGRDTQQGPLGRDDAEQVTLPANGSSEDYEFWMVDDTTEEGAPIRLASSYTPVPGTEEGTWESWGVDLILTCNAGSDQQQAEADLDEEWDAIMQVVELRLYENPDIPEVGGSNEAAAGGSNQAAAGGSNQAAAGGSVRARLTRWPNQLEWNRLNFGNVGIGRQPTPIQEEPHDRSAHHQIA